MAPQVRNKTVLAAALLTSVTGWASACSRVPQPDARVCEKVDDCALVYTACTCMVCDESPAVDAVNKRNVDAFDFQKQGSASDRQACTKKCSVAGACVPRKQPSAACSDGHCAVVWTPISR